MFDWINNITKESPGFLKNYFSKLNSHTPTRFVVFATEKRELIPKKHFLYSIVALGIYDNNILLGDSFEIFISQREEIDNHVSENQALKEFLKFIDNSVLVGYNIKYEIDLINEALSKASIDKLKNETIEIEIMHKKLIDNLSNSFELEKLISIYNVPNNLQKTTSDIVMTIAILFVKLKRRLDLI